MPRVSARPSSHLPSLLLAAAGLALGASLVHDAIDARVLTAASIFHSPLSVAGAIIGSFAAAVLLWDAVTSRRDR